MVPVEAVEAHEGFANAIGTARLPGEIGVLGLGKMGGNLARRLNDKGWETHVWNRTTSKALAMGAEGAFPHETVAELVAALPTPRVLWLMLPAGSVIDDMLWGADGGDAGGLVAMLDPGDIVVDGGNSRWSDTARRALRFEGSGVGFMDCGTSGGPGGARTGACLMIGGRREDYERLMRLWADLSVAGGFRFFPGHGAGHFVKMVHNGIEYGMMQSIAEGFAIMRAVDYHLDLTSIADVYNHGSVVESRLVGWLREALTLHGEDLDGISGSVAQTGEGRWTVEAADELRVKAKAIEYSVEFRSLSEADPSYEGQVLSALRERFGGHEART
jgi:6-phosphogluconate dehydrogenase